MSAKSIFREIDALTGKSVPKGDGFDALKPMLDENGKPLLTLKQGNELKGKNRGHYLSNAMDARLTTNAQFGKFYSRKI